MRFFNYLLLLTICVFIVSCNNSNQYKENIYNIENPDFSFLKETLKGKRIVAIGESSHGFGDLQILKGKIVQYLHKELGYEVLMMEGGYGDTKISWTMVEHAEDGNQIRDNSLFPNFRSEELTPLFDYILEKSMSEYKLIYSGYDTQISGKALKFRIKHQINKVEIKNIQDSIQSGLESFPIMFHLRDSFEAFNYHKNKLFAAIDLAKIVLDDNKEELIEKEFATEKDLEIEIHALDYLRQSVDYEFGEAFTVGLALRDSLMALNVIQQIKTEYPDKKIIIWGHNGHIEKTSGEGDNIKWMGHFLAEEFGKDYYALGVYCKKGGVYTHWNRTNKPFDITQEGFIEKKLFDISQNGIFVNLPNYKPNNTEWFHNQIFGYEPEAGGNVSFIPSKRFDGVMLLPETDIPTFIIKSER